MEAGGHNKSHGQGDVEKWHGLLVGILHKPKGDTTY